MGLIIKGPPSQGAPTSFIPEDVSFLGGWESEVEEVASRHIFLYLFKVKLVSQSIRSEWLKFMKHSENQRCFFCETKFKVSLSLSLLYVYQQYTGTIRAEKNLHRSWIFSSCLEADFFTSCGPRKQRPPVGVVWVWFSWGMKY